jgi:peptidoglycan/xylan/chitin deacetylase (PgdA/CDA1 family)
VLTLVVLLAGFGYGAFHLSRSRTFQLYGGLIDRVDTTQKVVALTFDDGPDPAGTAQVLRTLAAKRVRGTFYLVGQELAAHPELGRAIAAAGHEIGNHTYSHRRMVLVGPASVAAEIERTDTQIRRTGYRGEITFRPPTGKKLLTLPRYLHQHRRTTVTWDVEPDSLPEIDGNAPAIVRHTVGHVRPGSIVLLHPMYGSRAATRAALGPIIDGLRARGYRFVTVAELLRLRRPA